MSGFFERLTRKRAIAAAPAPAAARTTPPAKGYDALSTEQVIARMGDVSQSDLNRLAAHEREHQNRAEVLARIAALEGDEPWPGYDALSRTEVGSALRGASPERLETVLAYERVHKKRDSVLVTAGPLGELD